MREKESVRERDRETERYIEVDIERERATDRGTCNESERQR